MLSPDIGAGGIAGMDLSVAGASGIVFAFALWGSAQLIYALLQWVVIPRYRSLVSLMWVVQLLETLGRILLGTSSRSPSTTHRPARARTTSTWCFPC
jgi:hypothetical protein